MSAEDDLAEFVFSVCAMFVVLTALAVINTALLMAGWNLAMPHVFGLPRIGYQQAFGVILMQTVVSAWWRKPRA